MGRVFIGCLLFLLGLLGGITSCVSRKEYEHLRTQYDSLSMVNLRYQDETYETDSLVASIIANYQEISHIEHMINVNTLYGASPASEQRRIRTHVQMLSELIEDSNRSISLLLSRMEQNADYANRMQAVILKLREQIVLQEQRSSEMTSESLAKLKGIELLEAKIQKLRIQQQAILDQNEREYERLRTVEDSLNVIYYAMGTKYDLREMRLLNKQDKVNVDNAELSYLTKQDRRKLREINMMSKTACLLTIHPRSSYQFTPDEKGALVLEILEPQAFWSYSQIMLVEVDF